MEIITNAENRKSLVKTLSEHFGERAVYLGPPSFAYQIGSITVDRESKVIFEDDSMEDEVRRVLFQNDVTITEEIPESADETAQDEPVRLTIRIPIGGMTPQGIINLMNMLHSKQYLINRSIGENGFSISDRALRIKKRLWITLSNTAAAMGWRFWKKILFLRDSDIHWTAKGICPIWSLRQQW